MIGIVGGIGPMAGADLYIKIVEQTLANADQEHLPVLLASLPNEIVDRTEFLLGKIDQNPAYALAEVILKLESAGARYMGIACNTAHAQAIFKPMCDTLQAKNSRAEILHMIDETARAIQAHPAQIQRIGLLSTTGTYQSRMYQDRWEELGLTPVLLGLEQHEALSQQAIYTIKSQSVNIPQEPIELLNTAIKLLKSKGAQAIVLGCTELGMIEKRLDLQGLAAFNPNLVLARALIQKAFPEKLRP